jgi:tetratricopeptide (TPR) repeat protein
LLTAPTDLYDLGLILYELLTGKHPFGPIPRPLPKKSEELASFLRVLLERQQTGPPPLRAGNPKVSRAVAQLIERCLAFDPAKRPDAATLAAGLRRHFARPRWSARRRAALLAASLLVVVATAGVLAVSSPSPERDFRRGQEALRAGDWSEADRYFDRVLQADPSRADAWFAAGRGRLAQGEISSALRFFEEADRRRHRDGPTKDCLVYCLAAVRNHPAALGTFDQARGLGYESAALHNNRAYSLLNGKPPSDEAERALVFDEAERALEEALRLNPDLPEARYNRAKLAMRRSLSPPKSPLPSRAIEDIRYAMAHLPPSASLLMNAARVCAKASGPEAPDRDEIFDLLRQAVALGASPKWISREPIVLERMQGHPGYERMKEHPDMPELHQISPGASSTSSEPGLASPLTGLPD